jgi:outer membrane biosynthesis protein TonB
VKAKHPGRRFASTLSAAVLVSATAAGCARMHANSRPDTPPLDVPPPPARVVQTIDAEAPAPVPLPEEPPREPVRPRPAPAGAARPEARPEASKPETPATTEAPAAEDASKTPPTVLQTTPAAQEGEVERTIRATLARAADRLSRIDYRALNTDARIQYDTAKRFIQQSSEAIRAKNLVFAKNLADKAAALADQLGGR